MATTSYGTPYVEAADLVSGYPSTSLTLADRVDDISFKGNGINDQTGTTYTLDILDAGKTVTLNNSSAVTVTIPTNTAEAIEIGSVIRLNNKGAGTVTIQPAGTVTLNGGNILLGQNASAQIVKLDTNTWACLNNTPGTWISWTPTVTAETGTPTTVTASGRYMQLGKVVHVQVNISVTNKGTAAGAITFTIPVSKSGSTTGPPLTAWEVGVTGSAGTGSIGPSSGSVRKYDWTTFWVNGYNVYISATYEAA